MTDPGIERDVVYARAEGYWTSAPVGVKGTVLKLIPKSFRKRTLDLTMDIYKPAGHYQGQRPLLLMMHGGSFYVGHKEEAGQAAWCRHFASLGYVAASINYRLGFLPFKSALKKAELRAIEDADAALRYLLGREDLKVDPGR
ncbi:MAG: carboxylesterase family protein, partial [Bacteroidales bacterium]|nr:carboxylesterase family protein [Bacteroidales bacterium]